MFDCPDCGDTFASLEGVAMHYVNKESGHTQYDSKREIKRAVRNNSGRSDRTGADDSGGDDSDDGEIRESPFTGVSAPSKGDDSDDSGDDSSTVSGETRQAPAGILVRVEGNDGAEMLRTEASDRLDTDRGVLIENDGTEHTIINE